MSEGMRKIADSGFILALGVALLSACGPAATGAGPGAAGARDDAATREASTYVAQATLAEGAEAEALFRRALDASLAAIELNPTNPRAYLLAGQSAAGVGNWVKADTMLTRAEELSPRLAEQIDAEREEAWVVAYNRAAEALNVGDTERAVEHFSGADRMYQGRPEARLALGMIHGREGNYEEAIRMYRGALEILDQPASEGVTEEQLAAWEEDRELAVFNMANILAQMGRHGEAAQVIGDYLAGASADLDEATRLRGLTAQAAFLMEAGQEAEAEALYRELMERPDLTADNLFQIGVGLFNAGEYEAAANAFEASVELNPYSRDGYLNLVQSLFSAAMELEEEAETPARDARLHDLYDRVIGVADRVLEFDPYNRMLLTFVLRAYQGKANISTDAEVERLRQQVQSIVRQYEAQPYEVSQLNFTPAPDDRVQIQGVLTNLNETPGAEATLRFEILDAAGAVVESTTATVTLPDQGESVRFSALLDMEGYQMAGWRYEVVR
jgi:tetratricopeptide (TPR) repeat protein